jgi:hypothetical protein
MLRKLTFLLIAAAIVLLTMPAAHAARIIGLLSNFDVHNFTGQVCNDFELILTDTTGASLSCDDIAGYYPGWGTENGEPRGGCENLDASTIIIRWEGENVDTCHYVHLGVQFLPPKGNNVRATEGWWTYNGTRIAGLNMLWQMWDGTAECPVGDIVIAQPDFNPPGRASGPWIIQRRWAAINRQIPLSGLLRNTIDSWVTDWTVLSEEVLTPGNRVEFYTPPLDSSDLAVVVTYPVVSLTGDTLVVFYNAAWVKTSVPTPSLTGWGVIVLLALIIASSAWIILKRRKGVSANT